VVVQWDCDAIEPARDALLHQLADPSRELIGEQQLKDVQAAVHQSGAVVGWLWRCDGGGGSGGGECWDSEALDWLAALHGEQHSSSRWGCLAAWLPNFPAACLISQALMLSIPCQITPTPPARCSGCGAALAGAGEPDGAQPHQGAQAARNSEAAAALAGMAVQVRRQGRTRQGRGVAGRGMMVARGCTVVPRSLPCRWLAGKGATAHDRPMHMLELIESSNTTPNLAPLPGLHYCRASAARRCTPPPA